LDAGHRHRAAREAELGHHRGAVRAELAAPGRQRAQRQTQSLFERGVRDALAHRRGLTRLLETNAHATEPRDHVLLAICFFHFRLRPARHRGLPRLGALVIHEWHAEYTLRFVLIVRPAAEPDVVHACLAPSRHRVHVIELQPAALRAAFALIARERALAVIALPNLALHRGRDMPRTRSRADSRARPGGLS